LREETIYCSEGIINNYVSFIYVDEDSSVYNNKLAAETALQSIKEKLTKDGMISGPSESNYNRISDMMVTTYTYTKP